MSAADLFGDARLATLNRYPWAGQLLAKAPAFCVWILAAVLAWQLSGLVWGLFPSKPDDNVQLTYTTTASTDADTATTQSANVAPIVEAHLFGEAKPEDEQEIVNGGGEVPPDAPETNLPLELKGTLASDTPANALAIIADGRDEKVYRIDDVVRRGVTLHSVEAKRVLLSRAGTIEALNLPVPEETASTRPVVRRPTQSVSQRQRPSVRETITSNASALTEIISPRPYYVGGQQRGFRLYPSRDRQKFAALGLRPGDIVTEINGMPLTNAQQAAQVFSQLADAQSVTVMLERNGKPQSMTLDVNQIENATQAD
ncbi:MAG: type II secretion system protein GspC [Pseudomonadota bacterium]